MCTNYTPTRRDRWLEQQFGVSLPQQAWPAETWPGLLAPLVVVERAQGAPQCLLARFGLIPSWAREATAGRHTYNARSETVTEKPSFRDAWRQGRRCIIPAEAVYEPNWESGKAVRWRVSRKDGRPMGLAGLWGWWRGPDGREWLSFTMLTINADGHAVFGRLHRAGEEKRMVVILDEADYDAWLEAPQERVADFLQRYPAELLQAEPAPRR